MTLPPFMKNHIGLPSTIYQSYKIEPRRDGLTLPWHSSYSSSLAQANMLSPRTKGGFLPSVLESGFLISKNTIEGVAWLRRRATGQVNGLLLGEFDDISKELDKEP